MLIDLKCDGSLVAQMVNSTQRDGTIESCHKVSCASMHHPNIYFIAKNYNAKK